MTVRDSRPVKKAPIPYQGRPRTFCLSQIPENRCDQRFAVFDRDVESDSNKLESKVCRVIIRSLFNSVVWT
jgi:hypothetical protein